jgi:hypothetical protein
MNKSIAKRLDRLATRLLPGPSKSWQLVRWTPDGPINGPVITWRPGQTRQAPTTSSADEELTPELLMAMEKWS